MPWGVDFGDGVLRHPTQVYESLFHLHDGGGAAVAADAGLLKAPAEALPDRYGVYRFLTEFIRPEPHGLGRADVLPVGGAALAAGVGGQWIAEAWSGRSHANATP